jgi:hypothetical protein
MPIVKKSKEKILANTTLRGEGFAICTLSVSGSVLPVFFRYSSILLKA